MNLSLIQEKEFSNLVIVQAPKEFVPPTSNLLAKTKYMLRWGYYSDSIGGRVVWLNKK